MPSCHPLPAFRVPEGGGTRGSGGEACQCSARATGRGHSLKASGETEGHAVAPGTRTHASWIVSSGVHSESQGSVSTRRGCTLAFQARRVSSQDWGHKDPTKALCTCLSAWQADEDGAPELDSEWALPHPPGGSHQPEQQHGGHRVPKDVLGRGSTSPEGWLLRDTTRQETTALQGRGPIPSRSALGSRPSGAGGHSPR